MFQLPSITYARLAAGDTWVLRVDIVPVPYFVGVNADTGAFVSLSEFP